MLALGAMRILWVASRLEWAGGIGRVLMGSTRELRARGHEVHLAGARDASDDPLALAAQAPPGVVLHSWPRPKLKLRALAPLLELVREVRPDVVHLHSAVPHGELVFGLRLARPWTGRPAILVTPHTSNRAHYPKRRARYAVRVADGVITPSRWAAECAIAAGAKAARTAVVHAGIELPGPPNPSLWEPVVLYLGRLAPVKGVDTLIDAFARVAGGHPQWCLEIAGEGSAEAELRARAEKAPHAERIRFLGYVAGGAKAAALARAAIGVVPSYRESYGGTLLELQSYGVPCIASDTGGLSELAEGGAAARLVTPGSVDGLTAALGDLMRDAGTRDALGQAARESAATRSWSAAARAYEALYANALAGEPWELHDEA